MDVSKLIFLDESGVTTKMARRYGRSPKGQPLICAVPHGHWKTNTFIAGLRSDRIVAPWLIDGPMNGETFCLWLERELTPVLTKGDIVIMD
ncbi:MAG: transposase, partial [Asticcacaulis sp.]|nr:transposase [Asticcacaulis sp.]